MCIRYTVLINIAFEFQHFKYYLIHTLYNDGQHLVRSFTDSITYMFRACGMDLILDRSDKYELSPFFHIRHVFTLFFLSSTGTQA